MSNPPDSNGALWPPGISARLGVVAASLVTAVCGVTATHCIDDRVVATELAIDSSSGDDATEATVVQTLAGDGNAGYRDGDAASAQFRKPSGIVVAADETVYVADLGNHRIRRIRGGQVDTVAGLGTAGPEDGSVFVARLDHPTGLAVDAAGRVYIADSGNHKIRLVVDGQVSTVAGDGGAGYADGPAATAKFNGPTGVAVGAGGIVYVADKENHRIRSISDGEVATIAGTGEQGDADGSAASARFNDPYRVAVASDGRLFIVDRDNHMIRVIDNGVVSRFAGTGAAGNEEGTSLAAQFSGPHGISIGASILVADTMNHCIREIANGRVSTIAGDTAGYVDGPAADAKFNAPYDVAIGPSGAIYVVEEQGHRVRVIRP